MNHKPIRRRKKWWLLAAGGLALGCLAGVIWLSTRPNRQPVLVKSNSPAAVPVSSTVPRNSAKGVQYVGDDACRQCHETQFNSYREHPMGRSLAPVAKASDGESVEPAAFESGGIQYRVDVADEYPVHVEAFVDESGQKLVEQRERVHFAVGSGTQGRSYLINRDGHLYMSPLTWYSLKQHWDLSPGYEKNNQHFDRPVIPECLFCHANHAHVDEQARNHYLGDIFRGYAIGCERCHGPGELHVAHRSNAASAGTDDSIVNPGRLQPKLREAVCEQCHLSGVVRVLRRGKATFDFRPGIPLEQYWSVFIKSRPKADESRVVGHVEQMHASRCFRESKGQLGCISCHDPHRKPDPADSTDFYRQRCLTCHGHQASCTAPAQERQLTKPADDCVACHMPRRATEVRHTATTDHRVLRRAGATVSPRSDYGDESDVSSLAHFHRREWGKPSIADREIDRDLGIALLMAMDVEPDTVGPEDAGLASRLLQMAVAEHPDDVEAADASALSRHVHRDSQTALEGWAKLVKAHPQRERAWEHAARIAQFQGLHADSVRFWERLIELNGSDARFHLRMAVSLASLNRWEASASAARRALELQPANPGARQVLVESLLGAGDKTEADREFQLLQKLDPARADARRDWYEKHPLRQ